MSQVPFAYRLLLRALVLALLFAVILEAHGQLHANSGYAGIPPEIVAGRLVGDAAIGALVALSLLAEPLAARVFEPRRRDAVALLLTAAAVFAALLVGWFQYVYTSSRLGGFPAATIVRLLGEQLDSLRRAPLLHVAFWVPLTIPPALLSTRAARGARLPAQVALALVATACLGLPLAIAQRADERRWLGDRATPLRHLLFPGLALALLLPPALRLEERALRALARRREAPAG